MKTTSGYLLCDWRRFSLFTSFVLVMMWSFHPERAGYNFHNVTEILNRILLNRDVPHRQFWSSAPPLKVPHLQTGFIVHIFEHCRVPGVLVGKFNLKDEQTWRMTYGSCWIDIRWFQVHILFVYANVDPQQHNCRPFSSFQPSGREREWADGGRNEKEEEVNLEDDDLS